MNKKSTFIIFLFILILGAGLYYWYLYLNGGTSVKPIPTGQKTSLFPFGNNSSTTPSNTTKPPKGTPTGTNTSQNLPPRLRKVSLDPVAGVGAFSTASSTNIRYVDKATGHVYEIGLLEENAHRISNTTIPKVAEATFTRDGKHLALRYINEDFGVIETYVGSIMSASSSGEGELSGVFLPRDIQDIALTNSKIFYLTRSSSGSSLVSSNIDGSKKVEVYRSPLQELNLDTETVDTLLLGTKPSARAQGGLFILTPKTGILDDAVFGLTSLSGRINPKGTKVLFGYDGGKALNTALYDIKSKQSISLSLETLPEKCVWGREFEEMIYCGVPKGYPQGEYPDNWYQGLVPLSDELWSINSKTGETKKLIDPEQAVLTSLDITNPMIDEDGDALVFINKTDGSAWVYRLKEDL